ncbi:PGN_0703 family putative restriction endonuclease [Marinilabilia salmonicolor]|uniref:PGN_0703 family putative restriction endonuclease n=1 Tax=Marinilabilia salmonicolor TaxID=989 RepID=UPI00029ABA1F|nr:hypothetical protein [Marinilabilia salmonicolor]
MQNFLTRTTIKVGMIEKTIEGNLYKLPGALTPFQEKMYVHLINWKWQSITKEVGSYQRKDEKGEEKTYEYDAILPKSVHEKYPIIYPEVLMQLKKHKKKFDFKLHEHFNHMASSQAANVNLFLPILLNTKTNDIVKGLKPDFEKLATDQLDNGFRLEFWDGKDEEEGLLNDHTKVAGTDSDIAIAYYNKKTELCLWLIEHKLTEKEFTTCGGYKSKGNKTKDNCRSNSFRTILKNKDLCYYHRVKNYRYWDITESNKDFFANGDDNTPCPFKGGMNQLWRNQLLALGLEKQGKYKHVYFSVVHHPENKSLHLTMNNYRKLINDNEKFSSYTSKQVIDSAILVNDKKLNKWIEWYRELYNI